MNSLLELIIIEYGPNPPIAVASPVRSDYLNTGVTNIFPSKE